MKRCKIKVLSPEQSKQYNIVPDDKNVTGPDQKNQPYTIFNRIQKNLSYSTMSDERKQTSEQSATLRSKLKFQGTLIQKSMQDKVT